MPSFDVNIVAVMVASLASFVIGFIWYAPSVFGAIWMKGAGITKKEMDKVSTSDMLTSAIFGYITTLVMSWVLLHFLSLSGAVTAQEGAITAFWIWLGFVATIGFGAVLWERRPVSYYLVNALHWLVVMLVLGAILAVWV